MFGYIPSSQSEVIAFRCFRDVKLLTIDILNLYLCRLSRKEIISQQTMTLHSGRIRHRHAVIRRICRFAGNAGFQVQDQAKSRVTVEVVPMQSLRADKTQVFVDSKGRYVVDFRFESDLQHVSTGV